MTKGDRTRNRIIASAAPIFNCRGYAGCSMNDIVKATGLGKGGIYCHFESKESLAVAAFEYAWGRTLHDVSVDLDGVVHRVDRLKVHVDRIASQPTFPGGCPLLNASVDADDGNPALRRRVRVALDNWHRCLSTTLTEGKERLEVREECDPVMVADLLISQLLGACAAARLKEDKRTLLAAQAHIHWYLDSVVRRP